MKLIIYSSINLNPHIKNYNAIQRMCKSHSIEYEFCSDYNRIRNNDYNILLCWSEFINPDHIPSTIKIIYGPHFFTLPSGQIVGNRNPNYENRCVFNCLSSWIKELYLECVSDFIVPMKEFPFSVDTDKFKPLEYSISKEYDCILYIKRRSIYLIEYVKSLLHQKNINYIIFEYGSYNEDHYLDCLYKSKFLLSLDAHESQGFALEEAMAVNIPLLVMDTTSMYDEMSDGINSSYQYLYPKKLLCTSVPYWSDECGIKITNQVDLSVSIDKIMNSYSSFTPRDYILKTLSDEVCMARILNYFFPKDDIFIVTSVINTGDISWSYYHKRSIFTPEQRLKQTIETIESIRKYSSYSKILIIDASITLNEDIKHILKSLTDYFYDVSYDNEVIQNCILSNCKGLGDATLILKGLQYLKDHNIKANNIYKLSGRYCLNNNYNKDNISTIMPTFKLAALPDSFCTFCFSVPFSLLNEYYDNVVKTIELFKTRSDICIETFLPSLFSKKHIIDTIGAEGFIAIDESYQLYKV
jgi:glycosyltransferase involved in cell wall biosynthesis